ncbi:MAG: MBL fold metallo-hydrolase, partial [Candidatus Sumerlaeaceae bacterium]|nr:MBL fold metallo-hydrolase [Candidatus Sumerlaeaceae bacterium]
HSHYDHNGGLAAYLERFSGVTVYGGSVDCAGNQTVPVGDGDQLALGQVPVKVIAVPGHTPDHMVLYAPDNGVLFSGDALFAGSVGGAPSLAAKRELIANIKEKIFSLPASAIIYPGHGPPTTVEIERRANPFFH